MRCSAVLVKVTLKYTWLGRLRSMRQAPRQSHVSGRSYKQGNSPKGEIRIVRRTCVLGRLRSKWCLNIHYWDTSEVYAKSHGDPLAMDGAIGRGIPYDAKLQLKIVKHHCLLQVQLSCVYGQSDVEIYLIGSPLKFMPSPMTIRWLRTELQTGEFPQMWN